MKKLLLLLSGVGIGVAISWSYHKNKYEQMVQEEIESIREHMKKHETKKENKIIDTEYTSNEDDPNKSYILLNNKDDEEKVEDVETYNTITAHYSSDRKIIDQEYNGKPHVIAPEIFGDEPGYDADTLYYDGKDSILNDSDEELTNEEVIDLLGMPVDEIKQQFGVYEEDAVYFRNDKLKTDYEVLRDESIFSRRNGV